MTDRQFALRFGLSALVVLVVTAAAAGVLAFRSATARDESVAIGAALVVAVGLLALYATLLPIVRRLVRSRRAALAHAEAREQAFGVVLDAVGDAMVLADASARILHANQAFADLLGYTVDDLRGTSLVDHAAPAGLIDVPPRLGELRERGRISSVRQMLRADGAVLDLEYSAAVVVPDGTFHATYRDVTARRREREHLVSTADRLTALVETQREIAAVSGDSEAVAAGIVAHAAAVTGADGAALEFVEHDRITVTHAHGTAAHLAGRSFSTDADLSGVAYRTGTLQLVDDAVTDCRVTPGAAEELGVRSAVIVPFAAGTRTGLLSVFDARKRAFDRSTIESMRLLAQFAATAFLQAELVSRVGESEGRFRGAFESSATGIALLDLDGEIREANEALATLFGYEPDELVGFPFGALVPPKDLDASRERFAQLMAGELESFSGERRYLRKDGTEVWTDVAVSLVRVDDTPPTGIVVQLADATARREAEEALRLQGEIVDSLQTGMYVAAFDDETDLGTLRVLYANAASEAATGVRGDELVGETMRETTPELVDGPIPAIAREVIRTGRAADVGDLEYGGEQFARGIFSVRAFPLPQRRVCVTFENVTERVRASAAVRESESRFRGAFESSGVGMALMTLDGDFVEANDRLCEFLGYSHEELLELDDGAVTHPDDADRSIAALTCDRATGAFEKRYLHKSGTAVWGRLSIATVRDDGGEPLHLVAHVQDVTARKESEQLFEAIFERSALPKAILDQERRFADVNDSAAELLGLPRGEVLGRRLDDTVADPDAIATAYLDMLRDGAVDAMVRIQRRDGTEREVHLMATANITPGRHLIAMHDRTRQRDLELQLQQAQKMEAIGRLAGGIAHDFNNLLTAIAGYSDFLISGVEDEELRADAGEIRKAADRAAALTSQLLAFSRRQVLQPRVLDLNAAVRDMQMMLQRLIGEDVELTTILDPELGAVKADPSQVEQVIVNLVVNAREAMPGGGALTVETANVDDRVHGRCVALTISDSGVGLTAEERAKLFEPFFTTKAGGTGLGLATVYGIVDQSGGRIDVESELGAGTSFRIVLPRVEADVAPPRPAPRPETAAGGSETILLVEDEDIVRRLVAEMLGNAGYAVLEASDGNSAVELARRHAGALDLLVTDVIMPGMSGRDVAQAVSSLRSGLQVLYMSGYTDGAIAHHGVLEDGTAFLQKPFSAVELTEKVRGLLDAAILAA